MDHTETVPSQRLHLSGDAKGGFIAEVHDGDSNFAHQPDPATTPDASAALDALHAAYQKASGQAIWAWDALKEKFMAGWNAKVPPEPAGEQGQTSGLQQAQQQGGGQTSA